MNFKTTKKGEKLFAYKKHCKIWTDEDMTKAGLSIDNAVELGLFKEVPERIELGFQHGGYMTIEKCNDDEFSMEQLKIMEHSINGEWGQIPENLEFMIELINNYGDGRLSRNNLVCFIGEKLHDLKND